MTLINKKAQFLDNLDGDDFDLQEDVKDESLSLVDQNDLRSSHDKDEIEIEIVPFHEALGDDVVLEVGQDEDEIDLTLPAVPGGLDQDDIEEVTLEVEEPEEVEMHEDPWAVPEPKKFLAWLSFKMHNLPPHSGRDTAGIERVISVLSILDSAISKAVRNDLNNEIDANAVESARDEIQRGIERLEDRLDKVNATKYPKRKGKKKSKKADDESLDLDLVKEAQKSTHVGGIVVSVPLFISRLARVLINGMVSGGHDMEDMFKKLDAKYKLTDREKAELVQLLEDMNYPVRRDRGFLLDEEIDTTSSDNFDWAANYHA